MSLLSIVVVYVVILGSHFCLGDRQKRVINGVELKSGVDGRPTTYKAIRYYGALTTAFASAFFRKIFAFFGYYGDVTCGGSLLTPKIFYTACHCVSYSLDVKELVKPTFAEDEWAGIKTIYLGVSRKYGEESMEKYTPILTQKFILHQKCAKVGTAYTYDYALIQLPYEWIKWDDTFPMPWIEIEFAPQYSIKSIQDFYFYALRKQLVCLHVGFGAYIKDTVNPVSDVLLTGWGVLIPTEECYYMTGHATNVTRMPRNLFKWECDKIFPLHDQQHGKGDSGGPVTCDNKYFGVTFAFSGRYYSLHSPLYHDLFSTAAEYREDLIHSIDDLKGTYHSIVNDYYRTKKRRFRFAKNS